MFVRQDLPLSQQIVQSNHAILSLSQWFRIDGIPNVIVIGLPDVAALNRAKSKLDKERIAYYAWHEPDFDYGFTALATVPLTPERKTVLKHYRLYSPVVSILKTAPSKGDDGGGNPSGRATLRGGTEASVLA